MMPASFKGVQKSKILMYRQSVKSKLKMTMSTAQGLLFCAAIGLSCLPLADADGYGLLSAEMAFYLSGSLICGVISYSLLSSKGARLACGLTLLISVVYLVQDLSWCWNNALHPPHWKELTLLRDQAFKALDSQDWEKAENLYKAIKDKEKSGYFASSHSSNELALAYALEKEKKFKEAEQVYLQALHSMERTHERRSYELVTCVQNLAIFYLDQKRYSEAEPLFKRALHLHKHDDGTWESMLCRENYASLLRNTGRTSEATVLEKEAKVIRSQFPADAQ